MPERIKSDDSKKIEIAIQNLFIQKGWTLSTAESCTGGAIAARLTKIPGASQYFLGGVIAYSNLLKEKLLGVDKRIIASNGAVSEAAVIAMVSGALDVMGSDFAVAISGVAGPEGGYEDKPVGTVWIAVAQWGQKIYSCKIQDSGNRNTIIEQSVEAALNTLYDYAKRNVHTPLSTSLRGV